MTIDLLEIVGRFLDGADNRDELLVAHDVLTKGYRLVDDHAELPLTRGQWAKVSLDDLPRLLEHKWFCIGDGSRAHPFVARAKISGAGVAMARFVLEMTDPDLIADHRDWNTLNNQRNNLRAVNKLQSSQYRRGWKRKNTTSGSPFKGVYGKEGRWRSVIKYEGKPIHLGYFKTETEAAQAYDAAVEKYHGEYAARNYPAAS